MSADPHDKNDLCTVTMSFQCRRIHFLVLIPVLVTFSLATNFSMFVQEHKKAQRIIGDGGVHYALDTMSVGRTSKPRQTTTTGKTPKPQKASRKDPQQLEQEIQQERRRRRRKQKKIPILEPPPPSDKAFVSACLLIKDDNAILDEWIAYHYHTLRLRRLVVAVDPLSTETPTIQKWTTATTMEIDVWEDDQYMPADFVRTGQAPVEYQQDAAKFLQHTTSSPEALLQVSNHRYRQRVFLSECFQYLKEKNSTWVMHIDTDEYVVPSKLLREQQPDYLQIMSLEKPGAVFDLLQQVVQKSSLLVTYPCVAMLRLLFGSVESSKQETTEMVPHKLDAQSFETMRWCHHAYPNNMTIHGNPKVMVDVSVIPDRFFPKGPVYSIHRPMTEYCPRNKDLDYANYRRQPIAVNHYLGSWERYSGRSDQRRSKEKYNVRATVDFGVDDGVRPWLKGFVESMGTERAMMLLGKNHESSGYVEA